MNKRWIGIVVGALLSAGCAPQVIETPGGAVECYSKKCINEAQNWTAQHNRQVAKAEREEQKRQEEADKKAKDLQENPWKTYTADQVKQLAKENQIAIVFLQLQQGRVVGAMGVDLTSIQRGINLYGLPITKGGLTYGPTRKDAAWSWIDASQYTAICKTGALIDPNNRVVTVKEILPYAKENYEWAIWQVLCSNGSVVPEPATMEMKDRKS